MIEGLAVFAVLAGVLALGGEEPGLIVLTPDPDGRVGQLEVITPDGVTVLDGAGQGLELSGDGTFTPRKLDEAQIATRFADLIAAQPEAPRSYVLHFVTGESRLTRQSELVINRILKDVIHHDVVRLSVIGHTDTVGEAGLNARLGLTRALKVRDILVAGAVPEAAIDVRSHGEADLLIPTADNVDEARNRRVEVLVR